MTNRGFTLPEILVVISIITLLASIVFASLKEAKSRGEDAKDIQTTQEVRKAAELYRLDRNEYPRNYSVSGTYTPGGGGDEIAKEGSAAYENSMQDLVDAGYLPTIPASSDGESFGYYDFSAVDAADPNLSNLGMAFSAELNNDYNNPPDSGCHDYFVFYIGNQCTLSPPIYCNTIYRAFYYDDYLENGFDGTIVYPENPVCPKYYDLLNIEDVYCACSGN